MCLHCAHSKLKRQTRAPIFKLRHYRQLTFVSLFPFFESPTFLLTSNPSGPFVKGLIERSRVQHEDLTYGNSNEVG